MRERDERRGESVREKPVCLFDSCYAARLSGMEKRRRERDDNLFTVRFEELFSNFEKSASRVEEEEGGEKERREKRKMERKDEPFGESIESMEMSE